MLECIDHPQDSGTHALLVVEVVAATSDKSSRLLSRVVA